MALYARGLTVREIQGYLVETYGTEVSPQLISTVTDGGALGGDGVAEPATGGGLSGGVLLRRAAGEDPRRLNVVRNKAVYLALGVRRDGTRRSWVCGSRPRKVPSFG